MTVRSVRYASNVQDQSNSLAVDVHVDLELDRKVDLHKGNEVNCGMACYWR